MCKAMLGYLVGVIIMLVTTQCVELKKPNIQTLNHELNCNWGLTSLNRRVSQSLE